MEGLADLGEELVEDLGEKLYVSKETKPLTKLRERERERESESTNVVHSSWGNNERKVKS